MKSDRAWLLGLMLPCAAVFLVFFVIPLTRLLLIGGSGELGWAAYSAAFTEPRYLRSMLSTVAPVCSRHADHAGDLRHCRGLPGAPRVCRSPGAHRNAGPCRWHSRVSSSASWSSCWEADKASSHWPQELFVW